MISDEPLPPPYSGEGGYYRDAPAVGASLEIALHTASPLLLDVSRIERGEDATVVHGRSLPNGEAVRVLLPRDYTCTVPRALAPGGRYFVLVDRPPSDGSATLYIGVGSGHSILEIDVENTVDTGVARERVESLLARMEGSAS
jgi:hypothetical protein